MALLLAAALMAASPAQPADTGRGRTFIGYLAEGKGPAAEAMLNSKMAEATAGGKLGLVWAQLTAQSGAFRKMERVDVDEVEGYHRELVVCAFERAKVGLRVAFDPAGKVAGFFVVAVPDKAEKEAWASASYVDPTHFSSTPVEVGPEHLAGALVVPKNAAHFPIVVMVSGSGPSDMDETLGAIKPFRDLAEGLGSRGIASLRFEKRPHRHLPVQTVKEEYLDDAAAAIAQASGVPGVSHVLLLGHSLGATLAPRIAQANPTVAGAILLAGSTWPFPKLLVAQLEYQQRLGYLNDEVGKALIVAVRAEAKQMEDPKLQPAAKFSGGVTGAYYLDLRSYDAVATAGKLKIPMFFGWGEKDLKVIPDDWAGWKAKLGSRPNLTYRTYPGLQHLFTPVGTADVNHVSEGVVSDLAAWILRGESGSH